MIDFDELANELANDEALKLVVYDDATGLPLHPGMVCKGHPTIGIGRCLDTNGITREEALYLVRNDMQKVAAQLNADLPWFAALDPIRQTALANMSFNMGVRGLLGFHDTLSAMAVGNYQLAGTQMLASKWATQTGARATRIAEMIRTGKTVAR
jgi:lysozyme